MSLSYTGYSTTLQTILITDVPDVLTACIALEVVDSIIGAEVGPVMELAADDKYLFTL